MSAEFLYRWDSTVRRPETFDKSTPRGIHRAFVAKPSGTMAKSG